MNILFDIGHPAHVHLLKNFIFFLKSENHNAKVVTRNKDVTNNLLAHYGINFTSITDPHNGILGMLLELIKRDYAIFRLHRAHNFALAYGTSVSIAHLSAISKVKSYSFNEDDDPVVPIYAFLTYPFSTKIINPSCISFRKWQHKRVLYPSYHELAYLHPNNFSPNKNVLDKYGLKEKEFIIARFSAFQAHHDVGAKGISSGLWRKIENLCSDYQIVTSLEGAKSHKVAPWDMHHVLAYSKMLISDSQTMTVEGSVLGIPSIRINTFIGKSTVIAELEERYKLAIGILPDEEELVLETIENLLIDSATDSLWSQRREKLLADKVDLNQWMIDYFETEVCEV